jgi:glutaredoxin
MPAHIKMYTRRACGYCVAAERLLTEKGVAYEKIDATGDHATRKWLVEVTGRLPDRTYGKRDRSLARAGCNDYLCDGRDT